MKKIIIILLLALSYNTYGQTEYYSTDGENRISRMELDKMSIGLKEKYTKVLGKKMYVTIKIDETNKVKDSIIHKITFDIKDSKTDENFTTGPLSDFKNKEFPNFDLKTLLGENFNSEKIKGKPTMINFWFTKCSPCIDEMPILNKIAEKYKDDFNFIAITYETQANVQQFLKKYSFNFKHLVDANEFIDSLGIQAYPMNLFLDKNGVLKYVKGGIPYISIEGEELKMGEGNEMIEIIEKLK
jgi:cytochrome c biogenesis protein CcmG/thiol:disulfide interchange protein DsbE